MTITEMETEIRRLAAENELLAKKYKRLKEKEGEMNEILSGMYFAPVANERGAGRKPLATDSIRAEIGNYRSQGMTFKQIANKMGMSAGFIHKTYSNMSCLATKWQR